MGFAEKLTESGRGANPPRLADKPVLTSPKSTPTLLYCMVLLVLPICFAFSAFDRIPLILAFTSSLIRASSSTVNFCSFFKLLSGFVSPEFDSLDHPKHFFLTFERPSLHEERKKERFRNNRGLLLGIKKSGGLEFSLEL